MFDPRDAPETVPTARDEAMLDRLEDIFLSEGFRKVTVAQLASRLRCSRRTIYDLAPTKESLFLKVLERYLGRVRRMGDEAAAVAAAPDLAIVSYLRPAITETRKIGAAFSSDVAGFPAARKVWENHMHRRMGRLKGLVEQGVALGVFRRVNPILVAEVMEASTRRLKDPDFLAATGLSISEAFGELYQLLQLGLVAGRNSPHPDALPASGARERFS